MVTRITATAAHARGIAAHATLASTLGVAGSATVALTCSLLLLAAQLLIEFSQRGIQLAVDLRLALGLGLGRQSGVGRTVAARSCRCAAGGSLRGAA